MKVFLVVMILVFLLVFHYGGFRELIGDWAIKMFPKEPFKKGDKVAIYLNRKYNRTATISDVVDGKIFIYDRVSLPLNYRGRFYATGIDTNDGSRLIYVGNRKHYRSVRAAELFRHLFNVIDDEDMLPVSDDTETEETKEEDPE